MPTIGYKIQYITLHYFKGVTTMRHFIIPIHSLFIRFSKLFTFHVPFPAFPFLH